MRVLSKEEVDQRFVTLVIENAQFSTCHRSKCGSIIVSGSYVIGHGYNSQPGQFKECADCDILPCIKDLLPINFKSDKTCCVHAEQRAIMDALSHFPALVKGSTIWFIRLNENGQPTPAGQPYCTICSKMALDAGIAKFMLWHKDGWTEYDTKKYNELSFNFKPE